MEPDDIRLKGTRVGIETILNDYMNAASPEEIAVRYPVLELEQVYATITFYLQNKSEIDRYLKRYWDYVEESWQRQGRNPPENVGRLQELKRRQRRHAT